MKDLLKLISGSDIRGIAIEHEDKKVTFTSEDAKKIALGFGNWISKYYGRASMIENRKIRIAVGYDSRLTGYEFAKAIRDSLKDNGFDVYNCKMTITPSMFMTTIFDDYKADGAIMVTASHLPFYFNGMKFFSPDGGLEKTNLQEAIGMINRKMCKCEQKMAQSLDIVEEKGRSIQKNLAKDYSDYICNFIIQSTNLNNKKPLKGFKIVVDAGNGAAGFFADKVIKTLGGDPTGSQYLDPDGNFPNHKPNPEDKEAIESIKKAVLKNKADFGIIFDADGDRSSFVGKDGKEINKNNLIALWSDILLKEYPNSYIVTDSVTSNELTKFIEKRGGHHHRFKRGYKKVINEAISLNEKGKNAPIAIETSGHVAFKDNYFLDDGAYLAAKTLIELIKYREKGVDITSVLSEIKDPLSEKEIRIKIHGNNFQETGALSIEEFKKYVESQNEWEIVKPNYEGIRVNLDDNSWLMMRLSLHEPLLCINIETYKENLMDETLHKLFEFFENNEKIKELSAKDQYVCYKDYLPHL